MRIAVLGARSFSGHAFVGLAKKEGHEVLELNRPEHDMNTRLEALVASVRDFQPDRFVNFAALNMVGESWAHYQDYYRTNVIGVANVAAALRQMPWLKHFVQVSTPEVYGTTETMLKEDAPFNPSTPYAVSRAAADLHLDALAHAYGFPVSFTRSVNVYGPEQQPYRIIPKTVLAIMRGQKLKLHGGGRSERSFIHIDDMAEAIMTVAQVGAGTYHVSGSPLVSIRELVQAICRLCGAAFEDVVEEDTERLGKDMAYRLDDSKLREELGWLPLIDLPTGLARTVEWFKTHAADYASLEYEHRP